MDIYHIPRCSPTPIQVAHRMPTPKRASSFQNICESAHSGLPLAQSADFMFHMNEIIQPNVIRPNFSNPDHEEIQFWGAPDLFGLCASCDEGRGRPPCQSCLIAQRCSLGLEMRGHHKSFFVASSRET